jgi:hypothetical protein
MSDYKWRVEIDYYSVGKQWTVQYNSAPLHWKRIRMRHIFGKKDPGDVLL